MSKQNGAKPTDTDIENGAQAHGRGFTRSTDISHEMQGAYLDYAMSVIVARALPDVRDGLKPVHRRIMYALWHDLGLTADKPHKKSARIVGEVLGKYHPHGDSSVYDAMVRLAQPFAMRYPLIDGQGNFGSVDGDNAAAMRYTEARLAGISNLMMEDLEKDTVEWRANFDNTLREPQVVPAALPNLLINGSSGIAVGMATNIPPHNLGEVVDATVHVIDHFDHLDEVSIEDLLEHIKGPDFPTGGILYRYRDDTKHGDGEQIDAIAQGYSTGKARLIMQAKAHYEEMARGRMRIIITELPYQTNKSALIERIADLVRDGKIEGIGDLRDESDRTGMRVCIELKRDVDAKVVLAGLYKYTPLQQTFGMQLLALVDGQPKLLSLKRVLQHFVQHRQEIIRRRSEYDLARARERIHIVEGLLKALDILDEVIATIRKSQTVDTARKNLIANFKFTEVQAQAILEMQLRRLAALERKKLQEEYNELEKRIKWLLDLLANPHKVLALIREELLAIKEKYGDARRTQIVDSIKGAHTTHDLIADQEVLVTVGSDGEVRRTGVGRLTAASLRQTAKNGEVALLSANTRDVLYVFNGDGRCARIGIHELPVEGSKHVSDLGAFVRRTKLVAALALPRGGEVAQDGYLFLVTEGAVVKWVSIADVITTPSNEFGVINVDDKDRLGWAFRTRGEQDVMLVSSAGQAIRFSEDEVRSMGFAAAGVGGMRLGKGNKVIYASVVDPEGALVTVTGTGYSKMSPLSEYSVQGRNGGGIVAHKTTPRTGDLVAAELLGAQDMPKMVALLAGKTTPRSIELSEIPRTARAAQGKQIIDGATVSAIRYIPTVDEGETPPQAAQSPALRLVEESAPAVKVVRMAETSAAPVKLEPARAATKKELKSETKVPVTKAPVTKAPVTKAPVTKALVTKGVEALTSGAKTAVATPAAAKAVAPKTVAPKATTAKPETPSKAVKEAAASTDAARRTEVKPEGKARVKAESKPEAEIKSAPAGKAKSAPAAEKAESAQAGLFGDMDTKPVSKKASKLNTVTSVKKPPSNTKK